MAVVLSYLVKTIGPLFPGSAFAFLTPLTSFHFEAINFSLGAVGWSILGLPGTAVFGSAILMFFVIAQSMAYFGSQVRLSTEVIDSSVRIAGTGKRHTPKDAERDIFATFSATHLRQG